MFHKESIERTRIHTSSKYLMYIYEDMQIIPFSRWNHPNDRRIGSLIKDSSYMNTYLF